MSVFDLGVELLRREVHAPEQIVEAGIRAQLFKGYVPFERSKRRVVFAIRPFQPADRFLVTPTSGVGCRQVSRSYMALRRELFQVFGHSTCLGSPPKHRVGIREDSLVSRVALRQGYRPLSSLIASSPIPFFV